MLPQIKHTGDNMTDKENDKVRRVKFNAEDFIGVFENAYSHEYCDKVIEEFERADKERMTFSRQQSEEVSENIKKDQSLYSGNTWLDNKAINSTIFSEFMNTFKPALDAYIGKFAVLQHSNLHVWGNKIQRTEVGGGYHIWHCESSGPDYCRRALAYTMYLNDVEEGGETEFLYQSKRVKPEKGTLVIFPAAFTHTHRGNPPLSGTKYICTGWVEF